MYNVLFGLKWDAPLKIILMQIKDNVFLVIKLYLFYNDYETSYTTYISHARWHRGLRSNGLRVGGNRSARRKPTCLTW